ncbi:ATP-binding cassette domain-containing protein [Streptosporangium sp. NPDC051022]|uniref:ABC transporter ATP-binding protein n=1 Tax=Streptosporangium sp. NPDC051022 TaxID=3155752 RepID=UPI00343F26BC
MRPAETAETAEGAGTAGTVSGGLVEVRDLRKVFGDFTAVEGVSFTVPEGHSLGIVGESGSGKSTVARMIVGLVRPTSGAVAVAGRDRSAPARGSAERRRRGREVQMVFQDPYTSLSPRQSARQCLDEALRLHFRLTRREREGRVDDLLAQVGLDARQGAALPSALSGGQCQRVAIARALAADPRVLLLDESVSALDVSIQAQILNLLDEIRQTRKITYLFISHDLGVIRQSTDEVVVMRRGRIVEQGPTERVLDDPADDYTRALRASVPRRGWKPVRRAAS